MIRLKSKPATPEVVIYGYIINELLGDVDKIKSLESSINALDAEYIPEDEDDKELMNDPRYAKAKAAIRKEYNEELADLRRRGSHPDGLSPILVLLGSISMIRREVIEPAKEIVCNDNYHKYDIEFREIDSSQITRNFVNTLPKPNGTDGGLLIVKNISNFSKMYDITDQYGFIRDIMVNPIGVISTGWRIIFLEEADSEEIALNNSFVENWPNKTNLYPLYVVNDK